MKTTKKTTTKKSPTVKKGAKDDDRASRAGIGLEEPHGKILAFLANEFSHKEDRQCLAVDLRYAPGDGFRDEVIREWTRSEDPELFENFIAVEKLTASIIEIAENEADAKAPGRHRFVVIARQFRGGVTRHSFALRPSYFGGEDVPDSEVRSDDLHKYKRKRLLVRVAGDVASGVLRMSAKDLTAAVIAKTALGVAEEILKQAGF